MRSEKTCVDQYLKFQLCFNLVTFGESVCDTLSTIVIKEDGAMYFPIPLTFKMVNGTHIQQSKDCYPF